MFRLTLLTVALFLGLVVALFGAQPARATGPVRRIYLPLALRSIAPPPAPNRQDVILAEINAFRAQVGAPALRVNAQLQEAAQRHANDMAANGFFSHTGSDGSQPWERITKAGYSWNAVAENIAGGQAYTDVADAWKASPGHWKNMSDAKYIDAGIGLAARPSGEPLYVLTLGKPR